MKRVKGFKMTNNDMTCRNFKYEIGKEYHLEGEIIPCRNGFHFCKELSNCLNYYDNIKGNKRFFEIEAWGKVIDRGDKSVANNIKFIRELSIDEVFDYIRKNKDKVNWGYISERQILSEDFIREFKDKVDWWNICLYQTLSEPFVREFKDKVDWNCISYRQKLSEDFIREFKDKVCWKWILYKQKLSENFIKEFKDYILFI